MVIRTCILIVNNFALCVDDHVGHEILIRRHLVQFERCFNWRIRVMVEGASPLAYQAEENEVY